MDILHRYAVYEDLSGDFLGVVYAANKDEAKQRAKGAFGRFATGVGQTDLGFDQLKEELKSGNLWDKEPREISPRIDVWLFDDGEKWFFGDIGTVPEDRATESVAHVQITSPYLEELNGFIEVLSRAEVKTIEMI